MYQNSEDLNAPEHYGKPSNKRWNKQTEMLYSLFCKYYSKEPKKVWPSLIDSHSFMQTLTNQKSRTVSSWLLIGLNLHGRMSINQKRSHFWDPYCKLSFCLLYLFCSVWFIWRVLPGSGMVVFRLLTHTVLNTLNKTKTAINTPKEDDVHRRHFYLRISQGKQKKSRVRLTMICTWGDMLFIEHFNAFRRLFSLPGTRIAWTLDPYCSRISKPIVHKPANMEELSSL